MLSEHIGKEEGFKIQTADTGCESIDFLISGADNPDQVVFLSGTGIDPFYYIRFFEELALRDIGVIAPETHPKKNDLIKPATLKGYAERTQRFLDAVLSEDNLDLDSKKLHIAGHSFGAAVCYFSHLAKNFESRILFNPVVPVEHGMLELWKRTYFGIRNKEISGKNEYDYVAEAWKYFAQAPLAMLGLMGDMHNFDFANIKDARRAIYTNTYVLLGENDHFYQESYSSEVVRDMMKEAIVSRPRKIVSLPENHAYIFDKPVDAAKRASDFISSC